jgi:hypothetical protein
LPLSDVKILWHKPCRGYGQKGGNKSMKIEATFLAALMLIGTTLLARMAAQGVEQALFSTAIEYWLYARRRT